MKVIYMEFKKKLKKLGVQFWTCHVSISPVQGKTIRLFICWILELTYLQQKKFPWFLFFFFLFKKYVHFWDVWFFNRLGSHWWGLDKDKMGINKHLLLSPISFLYPWAKACFQLCWWLRSRESKRSGCIKKLNHTTNIICSKYCDTIFSSVLILYSHPTWMHKYCRWRWNYLSNPSH